MDDYIAQPRWVYVRENRSWTGLAPNLDAAEDFKEPYDEGWDLL